MFPTNFSGKRALVTIGASGLGHSAIELFDEMGATVASNGINVERVRETLGKLHIYGGYNA